MSLKFDKLKNNDFLSETTFTYVEEIFKDEIKLKDVEGNIFDIGKTYIENRHWSALHWNKTIHVTSKQLVKILTENDNIACSINFTSQARKLTSLEHEKVLSLKLKKLLKHISDQSLSLGDALYKALNEPIPTVIKGVAVQIMGYHQNTIDHVGILDFHNAATDLTIMKVDLKTLTQLIVKNTKYVLSKDEVVELPIQEVKKNIKK